MRREKKNVFSVAVIAIVALMIIALIMYKTSKLENEYDSKMEKLDSIEREITLEQQRTSSIENEIKYRQTTDYIEDQAREIFGLRKKDETIFMPKE